MILYFILDEFTDDTDGEEACTYADLATDVLRNPHTERPQGESKIAEMTRQYVRFSVRLHWDALLKGGGSPQLHPGPSEGRFPSPPGGSVNLDPSSTGGHPPAPQSPARDPVTRPPPSPELLPDEFWDVLKRPDVSPLNSDKGAPDVVVVPALLGVASVEPVIVVAAVGEALYQLICFWPTSGMLGPLARPYKEFKINGADCNDI